MKDPCSKDYVNTNKQNKGVLFVQLKTIKNKIIT